MLKPRVLHAATAAIVGATMVFALLPGAAFAQADSAVRAKAQAEKQPLLDTLKELVSIESGSGDVEGITRIGDLIAGRLRVLGGEVEMVAPPADMVRFKITPPQVGRTVVARFRGTGTAKILLLAHMDTVYQKGMLAQQPFRIDGDRAYGLGIGDDKHGVAVILHTLAMLKALDFQNYGLITVLINAAEEVASPSARDLISRLGAEHDITLSCEGAGQDDHITLATAGAANVQLRIKGRASHAGQAPQDGRNALYELAHQILQMRDLSDPSRGIKLNWTLANAGSVSNVIPADAEATADVRVLHVADLDGVEKAVRERVRNQLIPDTSIEVVFERVFPPMEPRERSLKVAEQVTRIYAELGATLKVVDTPTGGATDAAFASLRTQTPVVEGFGLMTYGAHSNNAEYINIESIEPRLYLLTRTIMDVSRGKLIAN
jgi:glutamate carboxypeptidase